jgi:tRNA (guanine-N7-)-methyltransferase
MPNLDYRFDKYTEEYDSDELERIREFARTVELPDRVSIEVGANRGKFLSKLANAAPDKTFIGVEWQGKLAGIARRRVERRDATNAYVLHADINHVLPVVFDDGQVEELFLMYPDPWWKTRHRKRRVIQPDFLDLLAPKMAPGGKLWCRTDVGTFADDMRETLDEHPAFAAVPLEAIPHEPLPQSTREKHVIRMGLPVHVLYYERVEDDAVDQKATSTP